MIRASFSEHSLHESIFGCSIHIHGFAVMVLLQRIVLDQQVWGPTECVDEQMKEIERAADHRQLDTKMGVSRSIFEGRKTIGSDRPVIARKSRR